ncbi:OmpP1/FadL family transporter [Bacterioplanes sanyensis]|nr:outer membrane protein transport protein [Bacterioplanes sanyensis]
MQRSCLTIALALAAASASGQGFYVDEQSALRLGNAFSGGAASGSDASTAYYNPAAMLLVGDEMAINLSAISVQSEFDGDATTGDGSIAIQGDDAEADNFDLLPTLYYVQQVRDGLAAGVYINAPYATGTDFGSDSVSRYQVSESNITGIDLGLALGFKATKSLDLGVSMILQYLGAKQVVAINTPALCLGQLDPATCSSLGVDPALLGSSTLDGRFEMEGDNTDVGFSVGSVYHLSEQARLGLHYRSRITHELTGSAKVSFPDGATTLVNIAGLESVTTAGSAQISTPEVLNLSYFQRHGAWSWQADLSWSKWSRYKELAIQSRNSTVAALTAEPQVYDWNESYRFAAGVDYQLSPQLTLRSGFAYDQSPIDDDNVTIDFGFADYRALSVGLSYAINDQLTVDAGFQHTLQQQRDIDQNNLQSAGARLNGEVTTDVNSAAVGVRWSL